MSIQLNPSSLENYFHGKMNFRLTMPAELQRCSMPALSSQSTLHSIAPAEQCCNSLPDAFKELWRKIVNFFRWFLNGCGLCETLPPSLSPSERENRLSKKDAAIQHSLNGQMQRNAEQMAHEPQKSFQYVNAPGTWNAHEERVGNMQVGVAHAQGRRPTMEDEHLASSFDLVIGRGRYPVQLFGIFDGHGGPMASLFVRDRLQQKLVETLVEFNREGLSEAGIWRALKMTCVRLNRDFKNLNETIANAQGTTATVAMILDGHLWTANVGDSRTVLDNYGTPVQLTHDAKPNDARYRRGIEHRGGKVVNVHGVPRVNGDLAVARAIGDHRLHGAISARPKITRKPMSEIQPESHLILCCDGIYDVARTIDVVGAAHANRHLSPGTLAKNIIYSAWQAGSTDNLSALVVKL